MCLYFNRVFCFSFHCLLLYCIVTVLWPVEGFIGLVFSYCYCQFFGCSSSSFCVGFFLFPFLCGFLVVENVGLSFFPLFDGFMQLRINVLSEKNKE